MLKASPSSSTTYQVISSETIFLFFHILCTLLGASVCFYFLLCFLWSTWLDPSILVWERDMLCFFMWILVFFTYTCWVFLSSYYNAFSSCFSCISCSELLVLVEKYSLVSLINYLEGLCWNNWLVFGWKQKILNVVDGILEKTYIFF